MVASKGNPTLDPIWDRVCTIFDQWVKWLELDWCDITLLRSDSANEDGTAADCSAEWQYRIAVIRVYLPALADLDDSSLERIIVHELSHILVNPMDSVLPKKYNDQGELATENVARAFVSLRKMIT